MAGKTGIRGAQIQDDSITGSDIDESTLRYPVTVLWSGNDPGTTYTVADGDYAILVNTRPTAQSGINSAITITMPSASTAGRVVVIKDAGGYSQTNAITIQRDGSDNFEGNPSTTSIQFSSNADAFRLISDGSSSWYKI